MMIEPGANQPIGDQAAAGPVAALVISDPVVDQTQACISTRLSICRATLKVCKERIKLREQSGSDQKILARLRRQYLPAPIVREISALYALHQKMSGAEPKPMLEEVRWFGEEFVSRCEQVQGQKHETALLDEVNIQADLAKKIIEEWRAMYESLETMWRTAC